MIENHTYDELVVGQDASLSKIVSMDDIKLFAAITGDTNPTHLDEEFAATTPFKGVVAHSMLPAGLISNLLGNQLPGAGTVYLRQSLRFVAPVRAGELVKVRISVKAKQPQGVVVFDCEVTKADGTQVLIGEAEVLAPPTKVVREQDELPEARLNAPDRLRRMVEEAEAIPSITCAIAHPCDASSLKGIIEAVEATLITPILVGPTKRILAVAAEEGLDISAFELIDAPHSHASAAAAVALVRAGRAELLMKGSLHTDELMAAVVAKETGLRTDRRISHVFIMDVPGYADPLFITDAAINIFPDLETKRDIVQNAIDLHLGIGLGEPRVAIVSAVETVNPKIPGTLDAAALCKMADRGQITGGKLDGPLALDNAVSEAAASIKGIASEVAGRAQILVVPDLEAGNMLAKNLSFLAGADAAGIVLGARVPIILTSRADSVRTRLASTAIAAVYAHSKRPVV